MRWLAIGVAVLAVLWGGWWVLGSRLVERGALAGIDAARAQGWGVVYDDISVSGFPNRFDTTLDAPRVTTPDGAVTWSAPFLQVLMLSYRPNRFIAVAPHEMTLETPIGPFDLTTADLRASAALTASMRPDLLRATIAGEEIAVAGAGLDVRIATAQLATRGSGDDAAYDIALDISGIVPGEALQARIDPFASLPATIDSLNLDLLAVLDRKLGATMETAPRLLALDVRDARLVWGAMRLAASGAVEVGPNGAPDGTISLEIRNWQAALRLAASLGLFPAERLPLLTAGLAAMADDDGAVSMDLAFENGAMRLGLIPLGPAPRF